MNAFQDELYDIYELFDDVESISRLFGAQNTNILPTTQNNETQVVPPQSIFPDESLSSSDNPKPPSLTSEINQHSSISQTSCLTKVPYPSFQAKFKDQPKIQQSHHQTLSRVKFSTSEDQYLMQLVEVYGTKNWQFISQMMGNRSQRQCRDRWNHYLSPMTNVQPWTPDEDNLLIEKVKIFGNKWSKIAQFLPGRTGISIRNRCCKLSRQPSSDPFLKSILNGTMSNLHI